MLDLNQQIKFRDENGKVLSDAIKLKVESKYVLYESNIIKTPRISSHTLVDLVGLNKYTTPGKTLLSIFGLVKRSPIDSYQTYKGGIAEVFAKRYLKQKYGNQAEIESFTTSQFKKFNQFPEAAPFSGVLDLMMHSPLKMTIEVKSKEMREYEKIAEKHIYPRDQVFQGANQAVLANTTSYMMLWVFLTPEVSKLIKSLAKKHLYKRTIIEDGKLVEALTEEDSWIWEDNFEQAVLDLDLKMSDFKFHVKEFEADIRLVNAYREKALKLYNEFYLNRRIEKKLFITDEITAIKEFIEATKRPE